MATFEQQYLVIIEEIRTDEKSHDESKQKKIKDAAELLLKSGVKEDKISARIKQDLKDTISSSYIGQCLEVKFKEKIKMTNKNNPEKIPIVVTNSGGNSISTDGTTSNNSNEESKQDASDNYERNKYKLKPKDINNVKNSTALERANAEMEEQGEMEQVQQGNAHQSDLIQSYKQQVDQLQTQLKRRDVERLEHTIVTLPKEKFAEVTKYTTDETVKRILFHFDENMVVTHLTVPI